MTPVRICKKLYTDFFFDMVDDENDITRTFQEFENFHENSLPENEGLSGLYAKVFKSTWFKLAAPLVYVFAKFQLAKYTNQDYLNSLIEKHIEESAK
jgi:hypothetical protein